ncbi:unnamed protein product [Meganyctiphanes norvegica]|uniref:Nephrin n=1 Tax=Meganyctiphanes norvegica TaxID=48144 RepID=A0AAV2REZ4_MEGNR
MSRPSNMAIHQLTHLLLVPIALLLTWVRQGSCLPQSFRVTPSDVSAVAGSDILLNCEVNNQQGKAQWTKDGFALGFDRTITGFSRLQMEGDEAAGIHNLKISNVTLADDAEYQCQVTPFAGVMPIRHAAKLTVLLTPMSIELVNHASGSTITQKMGEPLTLECLIKDAKPRADVIWKRGTEVIQRDASSDETVTSDIEGRSSVKSKYTFNPSHQDNGRTYSCHAKHPALDQTGEDLAATVVIDVHYEPGAPEISGYTEGEIVRAGDKKTLTCKARGGNPLPEVFWYKNGEQIDKSFNKYQNYAINQYDFDVDASDNLANYECHVMNVMTAQPKKAHIQLRVQFAPSKVTVTAPDSATVGDVITVSCLAENSNPPADVNIVINGHTPQGTNARTLKVENGGWNTLTNLSSYEVRPMDTDLTVNCYALNQALGSTKIDTKVINILREPSAPVILDYRQHDSDGNEIALRKGNRLRLTCVSTGGNPLAELKWFKGEDEVTANYRTEDDSKTAISELDIMLEESDNEAEYRCEASNSATAKPLINSTRLQVTFPPARVEVEVLGGGPVKFGSPAVLVCKSSSSNPPAEVSWWRDGFEVEGGDAQVETGVFGGTTTKYSLSVDVAADDNGAVYTCRADNSFGPSTHDALTLSVLYKPEWTDDAKDKLEVDEGESVFINVSAKGNPDSISYMWWHKGTVVMKGSSLNISSINKELTGTYKVVAENSEGSVEKNITISVKYGPTIMHISSTQNVSEGGSITLECHVDASPKPEIEWVREGYEFKAKPVMHPDKNILYLEIKNASNIDTGVFECRAKNGVGTGSARNTSVIVRHAPVIDKTARYQKAAAEKGGTARLVCRASASPYVAFTWYTKENTPIEKAIYSRFDLRYLVEETRLVDGLTMYESILVIKNVTGSDYGFFDCQARNPLGAERTAVHLDGTSQPDTPLDLKVVNVTHDTAFLIWTPGFDGGLLQRYRIRYHVTDNQRYQYSDVYPENATNFAVDGLSLATTYNFNILAYNAKGESPYSEGTVKATTHSSAPPTELPSSVPSSPVTSLLVVIITLVGAALLVLNCALIACFVRRRAHKRMAKASSEKGSSKSTTIEMYAPSSYTGTVTGETLSSISEKSRESYANEDSADEYDMETARVTAASTYLIEQLEPPPQYATRAPPHILPPPPQHNDLNQDDPYEIRRNQYNTALDRGYGTLGRRNTNPDHYNITADGSYPLGNRYTGYQTTTMTNQIPLTSHTHTHTHDNGSLQRNRPSKLHFPKDYIRNGSMNIPVSTSTLSGGQFGSKPNSPTRTVPPLAPMLSTFAPDITQPMNPTLPLEQRGHLV